MCPLLVFGGVLHFSPYLSVGPYVHTNITHLVSAQQLNFPLSKLLEIYIKDQEPPKEDLLELLSLFPKLEVAGAYSSILIFFFFYIIVLYISTLSGC